MLLLLLLATATAIAIFAAATACWSISQASYNLNIYTNKKDVY